ncbi:Uma2 family endonuclease [uncultured Nostoc sp.]|uniref:Uma2 family endonuclease n=1 Tax=uncultured Nostoc sp. TaxID=340711 RepID=UPI0035CA3F40
MTSEKITVQSLYTVTDEELMLMSLQNPELRFEGNPNGTLETIPPTRGISGNREIKAGAYLLNWVESQDLGEVFSSSTGFKLANTVVRCLMLLLWVKDAYQKVGISKKTNLLT